MRGEIIGFCRGPGGEQLARKLLLIGCYFKELLMEVNLVFS